MQLFSRKMIFTKNGFTLVELALVMVIIVLLLGLSLPSMGKFYAQTKLAAASRQMSWTLRYAHQAAVAKAMPYTFNFDSAEGTYWVSSRESINEISVIGKKRSLPEGISVESITYPTLTFKPDGSAGKLFVYLKNDKGKIFTIYVNPVSGWVSTYDYKYSKKT